MKISVISDHGKYRFHVCWREPNTPNKKPTRKDVLGRLFDDKKEATLFRELDVVAAFIRNRYGINIKK